MSVHFANEIGCSLARAEFPRMSNLTEYRRGALDPDASVTGGRPLGVFRIPPSPGGEYYFTPPIFPDSNIRDLTKFGKGSSTVDSSP